MLTHCPHARTHTQTCYIHLEVLGRGWGLNNLRRHANANTQTIIRDGPLDHTQTDEWLTPRTCIIHGTVDESVQLVYHHRLVCNLSLTAGERCATNHAVYVTRMEKNVLLNSGSVFPSTFRFEEGHA